MEILLKDRTTKKNIIWGTDSYSKLGNEYRPEDYIKINLVTNGAGHIVKPRVDKKKDDQLERTINKAEVFTPTWVVKKQSEVIESEYKHLPLEEYINKLWMEITCGEGPYMCNRYDMTTGEIIPLEQRVGFLDRKFRRFSNEIDNHDSWLDYAFKSFQSSYGYEFQGDSLLLARENLLITFIEFYYDKFKELPNKEYMLKVADIISYNVFQMDGLNYTIPFSPEIDICEPEIQLDLFGNFETDGIQLEMNISEGMKVKIKNWANNKMIVFEKIIKHEGSKQMKFDVVIGNPPYQQNDRGLREDGSKNASASPIYPDFVESAIGISKIQSLIIPARWITGAGKGLKSFSEKMINSTNLKYFGYFANSKDVFPDNEITGGVCYFVRDNNHDNKTNIETYSNSKIDKSTRFFDEHSIGVFIPFEALSNILIKVRRKENLETNNIQKIVSTLKPYGLRTDFFKNQKKYNLPPIFKKRNNKNDLEIFGLFNGKRTSRFLPSDYPIPKGTDLLSDYKVFLPYAYGGEGMIGEAKSVTLLGQPLVGKPNQLCTETYLNIGSFKTQEEAINLYKYIKTKFFRALVGILKSTQHATTTFKLVPLQDFTKDADIDWSESTSNIDQQLYKKYNLDKEEIEFIETNIKEME